ncbi:TlpA disulfide reductase family protein [uncultured Winogradskyella sp.]|uniref:TlpA family protein disulfide reductase n=1 Tax=uncultured Winogradskyella sp. TaxID=395353 RepID=UPI002637A2D2|nr:TlpA disulfide reductase family protein [uncultured Winogradskyella sp.]
MKHILFVLLLSILSCKNETSGSETVESKDAVTEKIEEVIDVSDIDFNIYDYDGLEPFINIKDDKVHVVNFWATWCAPCVKELPFFEHINENYKDQNVEVLLVSLDFPKDYEKKLKPFIKIKDLKSEIVALDDTDMNRWVAMVDKDWSGALPATIIYKGDKRQFYEKSFTQEELETELKQFLK